MLAAYGDFFAHKLDKFLLNDAVPPLERMAAFVRHAGQGMEKFQFRRGCRWATCCRKPVVTRDVSQRLMAIRRHGSRAWRAACAKRRQPAIASDASPQALARVLDRLGRRGDARRLVQSAAPLNQYWDFCAQYDNKTPAQDGAAPITLPTRNTLS